MEQYLTPQNIVLAVIVIIMIVKTRLFITKDDLDKALQAYMPRELCTSKHEPITDMKNKIDKIYEYLMERSPKSE